MSEQNEIIGRYSCSQLFGYKTKSQKHLEEDNVTAVKFDHSGKYLALGDKSGRLIVFQNQQEIATAQEYQYYFQFQARKQEYDTLKNVYIPEDISHIEWMRPQGKYLRLLTGSAHTIKLWKGAQRRGKKVVKRASIELDLPHLQEQQQPFVCMSLKNEFLNQSFSPINSMGLSPNEEYLYTSDQTGMFLWSLQNTKQPFKICQLKGLNNYRIQTAEKITTSQQHVTNEHLLAFGTNKGRLSLIDSRLSIANPNVLEFSNDLTQKSYIDNIIRQYTSVRFLSDGKKIVTRDLLTVKVWDMCSNRQPLMTIEVDQIIKNNLVDLFEADALNDSFALTEANSKIVTGNYGDCFEVIDPASGDNFQYELDYGQETIVRRVGHQKKMNPFSCSSRVLAHDFNEATGQLAISTNSCFFIFSQDHEA